MTPLVELDARWCQPERRHVTLKWSIIEMRHKWILLFTWMGIEYPATSLLSGDILPVQYRRRASNWTAKVCMKINLIILILPIGSKEEQRPWTHWYVLANGQTARSLRSNNGHGGNWGVNYSATTKHSLAPIYHNTHIRIRDATHSGGIPGALAV